MAGISKLAKFLVKKGHAQLVRDFSNAPMKTSLKLGGKALLFPLKKAGQGISWAHKKQGINVNFKEIEIGTTNKFGKYGTIATGVGFLGGLGLTYTEGILADQKFDTDREGYEKLTLLASKTLDATIAGALGFVIGGPVGALALGTAAAFIPKDIILGNASMWQCGSTHYTFNDVRAEHAQKNAPTEKKEEVKEEVTEEKEEEKTPEQIAEEKRKEQNAQKRITILKEAGINTDEIKFSGYADGEELQITYNDGSNVIVDFNMEDNELVIQDKDSTRVVKADLTPFQEYIRNPQKILEEQTLVIDTDTISSKSSDEIYKQLTDAIVKQGDIPFDSNADLVNAHYLEIGICHIKYADDSMRPVRLVKQKPDTPQDNSQTLVTDSLNRAAQQDSIARIQADSLQRDSIQRVQADSLARVQADSLQRDSIQRVQADSLARVQADSIQRDSIQRVQRDSIQRVQADSLVRVQADSIQHAQADSVVSRNDSVPQQPVQQQQGQPVQQQQQQQEPVQQQAGAPDKNNIFQGAIHEIKAPEIHEVVAGNTVWAIVRKGLEDANPGVEISDTQVWYECLEIGKKNPEIFGENPDMQKLGKIYPKQKIRLVS